MENNGKQWYQSKTIRFNLVMFLPIILALLGDPELLDFIALLPEQWNTWLLLAIPLLLANGNILLRFLTRDPIVGKVAAPEQEDEQVEAENK